MTVAEYYIRAKVIWDEIDSIVSFPICVCKGCTCTLTQKFLKLQQDQRLIEFLMKLHENYSQIRNSILMMTPLSNISQAYRILVAEQKHKEVGKQSPISNEALSFATERHTIDRCYKIHGYPSTHAKHSTGRKVANVAQTQESETLNTFNSPFTIEQYSYFMILNNKEKEQDHIKNEFLDDFTNLALLADSGATDHICQTESNFQKLPPCTLTYITLLYLMEKGLLFILVKDLQCSVVFNASGCFCQGPSMRRPWDLGELTKGLYYSTRQSGIKRTDLLSLASSFLQASSFTFDSPSLDAIKLWHLRLGHIPINILKYGPYHTPTTGNCTGFLTIVDDYSRSTWGDCIQTVVYIINRAPLSSIGYVSPYERLFGDKPSYTHMRAFGCLCFVNTLKQGRTKFEVRARCCVFLGYPFGQKAYKVYDLNTKRVIVTRDIKFFEKHFPTSVSSPSPIFFDKFPPTCDVLKSPSRPQNPPSHLKDYIRCKWAYKLKYKADGSLERYKARLVTKRYTQEYGVNYEETFSPLIKMNYVRCLIALAASRHWDLFQLDVNNAFLHGTFHEGVYMTVQEGLPNPNSLVYKLQKSLYGLKQASRQ
ncbi:uncharacterized protein LOC130802437 [Amaranthus tricolor]|uniref:uncharacterized protein LOC130802437 n=1 Tax=Amaranthus tricolor TaxID=29722 RepID=UPI00258B91DB|nr:uncharacterized protein LOC130802437 [Amaranthus tricolor]